MEPKPSLPALDGEWMLSLPLLYSELTLRAGLSGEGFLCLSIRFHAAFCSWLLIRGEDMLSLLRSSRCWDLGKYICVPFQGLGMASVWLWRAEKSLLSQAAHAAEESELGNEVSMGVHPNCAVPAQS